jgi:tRNA(Ile)-lysidine synthase
MAALGPFEPAPRLAVAVSGGPDSLALTLLAARWSEQAGGSVLGLTVDHGLRSESAAGAARVVAWLHARGIACRVLAWTGPKPVTGIQEAAREARYALLGAACREAGILHLLAAHHAQDQAETVCMRMERGSGELGLAGMAAVVERQGFRLLRPLLRVAPERLSAVLAAMDQPWLVDPANTAPGFRRAGLRAEPDFDRDAWLARAAEAARVRATADLACARFAAEAVTPDPLGYLDLALERWYALPGPLAELVLARSIQTVSGSAYAPPSAGVTALAGRLRSSGFCRSTLGGTLLLRRGNRLLILREPGRLCDRRELAVGAGLFWDRRFVIRYRAGPGAALAAALSAKGRALLPPGIREELRVRRVPAAAIAALPGLWHGETLIASPLHVAAEVAADFALQPASAVAPAPFAGLNVV